VDEPEQLFRGVGVSSGIAHGPAYVLACSERAVAPRLTIEAGAVEGEVARFEAALDRAERELLSLQESVGRRLGGDQGDIFTAQALVLRDGGFRNPVLAAVRDRHVNVEAAIIDVIDRFSHAFEGVADPYLRERAADIRDVGRRVISALADCRADDLDVPEGAIVVAEELLPSATARLETNQVNGFVTERGSKFSHGSILARSLGTPAVAGIAGAVAKIKNGDRLVVDGVSGLVFVNPRPSVQAEYERLSAEIKAYRQDLQQLVDLPAVTLDGTPLGLFANVSKFADTEAAFLYKAPAIGLYRTEFGFTVRSQFPTTDEQFEFLERAAERFHPRRIVFRLLDVGGDKMLSYFPLPTSRNPSLAQRGIRLLLAHPEILRSQLRAFLRVSAEHPISILLPMVTGIEEVRATRAIVREVEDELAARGIAFARQVPLGAMIEVPSAALMVPALAREVDFFSLGTNDLVQYVLAADREDETVAPYYQPLHPAVLRLIQMVAQGASAAGRPLTICGELAGDPLYTELLVGLGLREMSVAPGEMLAVKDAMRRIDLPAARDLARQALELGSIAEIAALLTARQPAGPVISAPLPRRSQRSQG
jgi:phosphoenolpyruvate-protein phosphotransferase